MPDTIRQAAQTVRRIKNTRTEQERLHGWQNACSTLGLSGEFALAARTGAEPYTEEQAEMVAELFGR